MYTFAEYREMYEGITGRPINTVTLGMRINEAQVEIAKKYGRRISVWYPLTITQVVADVAADANVIHLHDSSEIEAPGELVLGRGRETERIYFEAIAGNSLIDVGRMGSARAWPAGTTVSEVPEYGTEYELPQDLLSIHEVRDVHNMPAFEYQVTQAEGLSFFKTGMYRLIYTKVPDPIDYTDNNSRAEVHPIFSPAILKYCIAKQWEDDAEGIPGEENKAMNLMAQFRAAVDEAATILKRNPNQQYTIGINLW